MIKLIDDTDLTLITRVDHEGYKFAHILPIPTSKKVSVLTEGK